jgi:hypothetical protein
MRCRCHNCSRVSVRRVSRALQTRQGCASRSEAATVSARGKAHRT